MTRSKIHGVAEMLRLECAEKLRMLDRAYACRSGTQDSAIRLQILANVDEHIPYLIAAIRIGEPRLFALYANWAKRRPSRHELSKADIEFEFKLLETLMVKHLSESDHDTLRACIAAGIEEAFEPAHDFEHCSSAMSALMLRYTAALLDANRDEAAKIVSDAIETGTALADIYLGIFQESQYEIGRLWLRNKLSVAQEHYCTAITQMIMAQLYPRLMTGKQNGKTVITTCVNEEQHEVGIRMVADLLELEGFNTLHVGANCPRADLVKLIDVRQADIVAISATMTYHLPDVKQIIAEIRKAKFKKQPCIMVGGYPFNQIPLLWRQVGADASAPDAAEAALAAKSLAGVD